MKRIAVKIGSNVLTRKDGTLDITRMSALVDQVADLHRQDKGRQKAGSRISPATVFGGRTGQVDQPVLRVIPGAWHDLRASAYYKREFRESYALPKPEALHGGNA